MSTIPWPSSLPEWTEFRGYTETPQMPVYSFQPEEGEAIERPGGTLRMTRVSRSFIGDSGVVDEFEKFYRDTLARGSLSFYATHPRRDEQVRCRIIKKDGGGYTVTAVGPTFYRIEFEMTVIG